MLFCRCRCSFAPDIQTDFVALVCKATLVLRLGLVECARYETTISTDIRGFWSKGLF